MNSEPVIVVAPARSATSAVARMLHHECGVCMGHRLREANANNPDGYYEDLRIQRLNRERYRLGVQKMQYANRLRALLRHRDCDARRVGFKDPCASEIITEVLAVFPRATYIRCKRPFSEVQASWQRIYGNPAAPFSMTDEEIDVKIRAQEKMLDRWLPEAHVVTTYDLTDDPAGVLAKLKDWTGAI